MKPNKICTIKRRFKPSIASSAHHTGLKDADEEGHVFFLDFSFLFFSSFFWSRLSGRRKIWQKHTKINFLWKSSWGFVGVFTSGVSRGWRTGIAKKIVFGIFWNFPGRLRQLTKKWDLNEILSWDMEIFNGGGGEGRKVKEAPFVLCLFKKSRVPIGCQRGESSSPIGQFRCEGKHGTREKIFLSIKAKIFFFSFSFFFFFSSFRLFSNPSFWNFFNPTPPKYSKSCSPCFQHPKRFHCEERKKEEKKREKAMSFCDERGLFVKEVEEESEICSR